MYRFSLACAAALAAWTVPAHAGEVFAGAYVHGVDTPFTLDTPESGTDVELGYRFDPIEGLRAIGKPSPYLFASVNTGGDTSFAGAGLAWKVEKGRFYIRPGIGFVVQDGPRSRIDPLSGKHTELGSRVLFEPELALGTKLSEQLSVEASWVHISHARLFNARQNPGVDMMGVRLNWRL
ncbi:acyloxyacyl hydrolase [Croceibacterium aestuarii]|uniref:acyloxyacyl hydrolase n=1 Tax=Croceibacterium aestuarii TaxID=3064139 RepID=UPI00272E0EB6|nr:acyloxyacyl hydrolase [Croceibacterium sp. D39]